MSWINRTKPETTWSNGRESIGDIRITEGGNQRVSEVLFTRILEFFSWGTRTKPSTSWSIRTKP